MAGDADRLLTQGVEAADAGRVRDGLELIRAACAADPGHADARAQLGRWLSRLHRTDESMAAAQQALALSPLSAQTLDTIGVVFSRAGRHDLAAPCFERATALEPGVPACTSILRRP